MASGTRRKRAAKKKKQNKTNKYKSLQGNGDPRSNYEKGSDSGEVSSSTSQEQNHHQSDHDEVEDQRVSLAISIGSVAAADTNLLERSQIGNNGEEVFRDLKKPIEDRVEVENGDHSTRTSGCSSDEESHPNMMKEVPKLDEEEKGMVCTSEKEMNSAVDPIKQIQGVIIVDPVEKVPEVAPAEKIGDLSLIDLPFKEIEEKTLLLSAGKGDEVENSNCGEDHRESETPKNSDNQQLIASAPPRVQPTSWKSCCGLFDVLMGSNR